jgi:hypothetical protein
MGSQPILCCSDYASSVSRRDESRLAGLYLDEDKPVTLLCDERNRAYGRSVIPRENLVPLKPQHQSYERRFDKISNAEHRRPKKVAGHRHARPDASSEMLRFFLKERLELAGSVEGIPMHYRCAFHGS